MDEYQKISLFLSFCNIVILPLGIFLYRYIKHWRQENEKIEAEKRKRVELMENLQMSLTRDRLMQSGDFFCRMGAIPANIKRNLIEMGEAYVALGGNGDGHKMLEKVKNLDVDDNILKRWYEKRLHYEI